MRRKIVTILLTSMSFYMLAQNMDDIEITVEQITPDYYVLKGAGGNIGLLVSAGEALMIDAQFAPLSVRLLDAIDHIAPVLPSYLVNTHWHGDHTGGNGNFSDAGVQIVAQEEVKTRLSEKQFIRAFSRDVPPSPENYWPTVTFADSMTLTVGSEMVMLLHPTDSGHTDGDGIIYCVENDVLHMGDLYFQGRYPYVDLSTGGSVDGLIAGVKEALLLVGETTRVVPGHGNVTGRAGLEDYLEVVEACRDIVSVLMKEGLSLDQIKAAKPLAKYDDQYGTGFIKPDAWIDTIYTDLSRS